MPRGFLSCDVAKGDYRSITEPKTESSIRGPREGFVEDIEVNMALVRKRLKSPNLIFESFVIGSETATNICMAYMGNIADEGIVGEFRRRLDAIQTDSVLESAYIEEWIQDKTLSPFPQLISTERPDGIVAKLLEGQVAVLIDGTPMALAGPITSSSCSRRPKTITSGPISRPCCAGCACSPSSCPSSCLPCTSPS